LISPKMSSGNAIRVCSFLLVVALLTAEMISAAPYNDYDRHINGNFHFTSSIQCSGQLLTDALSMGPVKPGTMLPDSP
ncbi:hypothetical protein NPIL_199121, partial [Nephila pilipes]